MEYSNNPVPGQSSPFGADYSKNSSIYPYYKENNVFERDEAYYNQLLSNTRRNNQYSTVMNYPQQPYGNFQNSRTVQPQYQQVETRYPNQPGMASGNNYPLQQSQMSGSHRPLSPSRSHHERVSSNEQLGYVDNTHHHQTHYSQNPNDMTFSQQQYRGSQHQQQQNFTNNAELSNGYVNQEDSRRGAEENRRLKEKLDDLINFRDEYDDGNEVVKKQHYNRESDEGRMIARQEEQIQSALLQINRNNADIYKYKTAIAELQKSMNNIQSVDREIYRQLQTLTNRDQELLDRATTALARGASREQVASILDKILS